MILLTKAINERLTAEGLPELAIKRDSNGMLILIGRECEKVIATFSTIFVSKKLTVTERSILTSDYIDPILTTHKKDLITLIALMKDKTIEDAVRDYYEKCIVDEELTLSATNSYDYDEEKSLPYLYSVESRRDKDDTGIQYYVKEKQYRATVQHTNSRLATCKAYMKSADKIVEELTKILNKWKDLNEALIVKNEKVKEIQDAITVKCKL